MTDDDENNKKPAPGPAAASLAPAAGIGLAGRFGSAFGQAFGSSLPSAVGVGRVSDEEAAGPLPLRTSTPEGSPNDGDRGYAPQAGGYGSGDYGAGPYGGSAEPASTLSLEGRPPKIEGSANIMLGDATLRAEGAVGIGVAVSGRAVTGQIVIDDIPKIWLTQGGNPFLQIDRAEQELVAVRTFVLELRARNAADPNAHNNPPELVDDPEIDLEAVDAAIQCLTVLRPLLSQPQPDIELLRLLWRVVVAALRAIERLSAWIGRVTKSAINAFTGTTFGKAYMTALGAGLGTATAAGIVYGISQHGPEGLQAVEHILRGVLAVMGHAV